MHLRRSLLLSFTSLLIFLGCMNNTAEPKKAFRLSIDNGISCEIVDGSHTKGKIIDLCTNDAHAIYQLDGRDIPALSMTFSEPIYVSRIKLIIGGIENDSNKATHIRIEFKWDKDAPLCDYLLYKIDMKQPIQIIDFSKARFASLLKYKYVTFSIVKDKDYQDTDKILILNKLFIVTTKSSLFKQNKSLYEIQKNYLECQNDGCEITKDSIDVLQNLIYLALNGDKKAEKIFLSLKSAQADSSEFISNLKDWFCFMQSDGR